LKRFVALIGMASAVCLAQTAAAQLQERYKIRLTTVPMDGGMRNTVAGSGSASAVLTGSKLAIAGTFAGLRSPATAAALHRGIAKGVRGAPVANLAVSRATNGTISGSVELTADQVKGLREGQLYVQIASEKAPEGNLWGWLLK